MEKNLYQLDVSIYGNLIKFNDTISQGRCRLFYKYKNRNGTYITDEFADKLLKTVAYAPVKGIYDTTGGDYTDHGESRNQGRIYGVVPADPHITWEDHLDSDGIVRTYACVDVLIYTALYTEANIIIGKSQSMELYRNSIKGDYKIINGESLYVYTDGCFLGLQALGDNVEPCFEGAEFYQLYQFCLNKTANNDNNLGGHQMVLNFKMSDSQKWDALWILLNPNYTKENDWVVEYGICDIYDDYALVRNYVDSKYERVYYSKNDETDSIEITKKEDCFIIDVNEDEYNSLKLIRQLNDNTYSNLSDNFVQKSELETKINEYENSLSTLKTEKENVDNELATARNDYAAVNDKYIALNSEFDAIKAEKETLIQYKLNIERNEKLAIIANYENILSDEIINSYKNSIDKYSNIELDMQLTYEIKKSNPEKFALNSQQEIFPKDNHIKTGIDSILSKYERK